MYQIRVENHSPCNCYNMVLLSIIAPKLGYYQLIIHIFNHQLTINHSRKQLHICVIPPDCRCTIQTRSKRDQKFLVTNIFRKIYFIQIVLIDDRQSSSQPFNDVSNIRNCQWSCMAILCLENSNFYHMGSEINILVIHAKTLEVMVVAKSKMTRWFA